MNHLLPHTHGGDYNFRHADLVEPPMHSAYCSCTAAGLVQLPPQKADTFTNHVHVMHNRPMQAEASLMNPARSSFDSPDISVPQKIQRAAPPDLPNGRQD